MIARALAVLFLLASPAGAQVAHWGIERYAMCDESHMDMQLGSGGNVMLRRITGVFSGMPSLSSSLSPATVRTGLLTILSPTLQWAMPPNGRAIGVVPADATNGADNGLASVILKQNGAQVVTVPQTWVYDPPVLIPGGVLWLSWQIHTYGPGAETAPECLDIEQQTILQFDQAPAP